MLFERQRAVAHSAVDQRGPIYRSTENRDLVLSAARSRGFAFAPPATAVHPGAATALFVKDSTGQ